ncbi:MAG: TonB-dependent receptor [Sulfuricellaceae bacterium]
MNNFITSQKSLRPLLLAVLLSGPVCGFAVFSEAIADADLALADYSLEQLMDMRVEVTSAGRKAQKLEDTAAAIYVITAEEIRRSGMTSIPELLRMVPGLQVAQIDASTWAISSRGFNGPRSSKLLVLLDGRTLYTPTNSGVDWDTQDTVLEDIERIEVIRGTGGTMWGANAVNGVISIITKSAAATHGGLVNAGISNTERQGTLRYGGHIGEAGHFRVYAKSAAYDSLPLASGAAARSRRDLRRAGFRADWVLDGGDTVTAQGDAYEGSFDYTASTLTLAPPANTPTAKTAGLKGGNLLARWQRALSATSDWALQFYYDAYERRNARQGGRRDTYDLDFQHHFLWDDAHDIVWGGGYRQTGDRMDSTFKETFNPAQRTDQVVNAFIQDEIALNQDSLYLIVGSKFERNDYTGFEYEPNLRLRWKIDAQQTAWAAVSRAIHAPSREDVNLVTSLNASAGAGGITSVRQVQGNPAMQSTSVLAYEAGYRAQPGEQVQVDATAFYNEYCNLKTTEPAASYLVAGDPGYRVLPQVFANKAGATTHGMEWSGNWRPRDKWQIKAAYTWLKMDIRRDADSGDASIEREVGLSPQSQWQFQVFHSPVDNLDLSAALYYVDGLPRQSLPAYTRFDARAGWRVRRDLELSLTGHNLFDPGHSEYGSIAGNIEIPRSIYGAATWRF